MDKNIFLVGLNHRSASVDVREKFALTSVADFEKSLLAACPLREVMPLASRVKVLAISYASRCTMTGSPALGIHTRSRSF